MSNYTKSTNFATKDNLPTNDPAKIIKGTEIDNEFNAIASAVASKADLSSPAFTGTPTAPTAAPGTNSTQVATTAFVAASVGTVTNIAGGGQNRVVYQSAADTTAFAPAPTVAGTYLGWTGSAFAWSTVSASTSAALTINNSGSGASSGATFNGSLPVTISYNTVGAPSTSGAGATGTWGINITGSSGSTSFATSAGSASTATTAGNLTGSPTINVTQVNVVSQPVFQTTGGALGLGTGMSTAAGLTIPQTDASSNLGNGSFRWAQVFAVVGTINTSDANEKTEIAPLDEAEKRVAQRIKGLIKKFKFKDAVAKKGSDGARIHVGVIAQEVQQAFETEGLDPNRYSLFCYDEWAATPATYDKAGNVLIPASPAGSRYGVRYEELLAFVIASM